MPINRSWFKGLRDYFTLRQALVNTGTVLSCIALLLLFDFVYSTLTAGSEARSPRISNPVYDHGLVANFSGYEIWKDLPYRLITNNLGFKDASVREVLLKPNSRRILLIGDSFTEAVGIDFEDSFAGLLFRAGQARAEKVEFLNAGVVSYSPSVYYKKTKYLIESGLQFDEVVLFSDLTDVTDKATSYFCIDDDPKYRAHCTSAEGSMQQPLVLSRKGDFFIDHFAITNRLRVHIKQSIQSFLGNKRRLLKTDHTRIGWAVPRLDVGRTYDPLGVDGGVERSRQNMRAFSDLLSARKIPLTIVVYPWAQQIAQGDRESRQVSLWQDFCVGRCKAFINLYPVFFAAADVDKNWYERLYIFGDDHFSKDGNRLIFRELATRLF